MLNNEASDFSLARRVLADYHPLQPEMIMQLAMQQQPQFLCAATVHKFVVPVPWQKDPPQIDWINVHPADGKTLDWINVHPADGKTLVASVMYTHTNDRHYGQWLLLNVPFRNIDDLVPAALAGRWC
eukprot:s11571_g1.t1